MPVGPNVQPMTSWVSGQTTLGSATTAGPDRSVPSTTEADPSPKRLVGTLRWCGR